jgi:hypothetical protein
MTKLQLALVEHKGRRKKKEMEPIKIAIEVYFIGFVVATLMAFMMKIMMMTLQRMGRKKRTGSEN